MEASKAFVKVYLRVPFQSNSIYGLEKMGLRNQNISTQYIVKEHKKGRRDLTLNNQVSSIFLKIFLWKLTKARTFRKFKIISCKITIVVIILSFPLSFSRDISFTLRV